jgi:hypothetical protein
VVLTKLEERYIRSDLEHKPSSLEKFYLALIHSISDCLIRSFTYSYIRLVDALWCRDMKAIDSYNCCKIIYDNTREVGRKWKVARRLGIDMSAVLGCSLFLLVRTVVNPFHFRMLYFN